MVSLIWIASTENQLEVKKRKKLQVGIKLVQFSCNPNVRRLMGLVRNKLNRTIFAMFNIKHMRLFVVSKITPSQKYYLPVKLETRAELRDYLNSDRFQLGNEEFSISEVKAEVEKSAAAGLILGAVIGLLGGGIGALGGGLVGGIIGNNKEQTDLESVRRFNQSM